MEHPLFHQSYLDFLVFAIFNNSANCPNNFDKFSSIAPIPTILLAFQQAKLICKYKVLKEEYSYKQKLMVHGWK